MKSVAFNFATKQTTAIKEQKNIADYRLIKIFDAKELR